MPEQEHNLGWEIRDSFEVHSIGSVYTSPMRLEVVQGETSAAYLVFNKLSIPDNETSYVLRIPKTQAVEELIKGTLEEDQTIRRELGYTDPKSFRGVMEQLIDEYYDNQRITPGVYTGLARVDQVRQGSFIPNIQTINISLGHLLVRPTIDNIDISQPEIYAMVMDYLPEKNRLDKYIERAINTRNFFRTYDTESLVVYIENKLAVFPDELKVCLHNTAEYLAEIHSEYPDSPIEDYRTPEHLLGIAKENVGFLLNMKFPDVAQNDRQKYTSFIEEAMWVMTFLEQNKRFQQILASAAGEVRVGHGDTQLKNIFYCLDRAQAASKHNELYELFQQVSSNVVIEKSRDSDLNIEKGVYLIDALNILKYKHCHPFKEAAQTMVGIEALIEDESFVDNNFLRYYLKKMWKTTDDDKIFMEFNCIIAPAVAAIMGEYDKEDKYHFLQIMHTHAKKLMVYFGVTGDNLSSIISTLLHKTKDQVEPEYQELYQKAIA
ncbi:MAG TPA: hypothetical protein VLF89_07915 [Candidatus Saccharimonadales bacterium]|nr:hypothetical protein [Candidatus Saccharimonadales bacterium]